MNIGAHIKSERASWVCLLSSSIRDLLTVNVSSAGPSERNRLWSRTQTSLVTEEKSCGKYPDDAASPAVRIAAQADGNKDVSETEHWVVHSATSLAEELKRSDRLFKKTTKVLEPHSTRTWLTSGKQQAVSSCPSCYIILDINDVVPPSPNPISDYDSWENYQMYKT